MKALTQEQIRRKNDLANTLADTKAALDDAIGQFNAQMAASFAPVEALASRYNALLDDVCDFVHEIYDRQEAYMEDRSDTWMDGDSGEDYRSWHAEWELAFEEIEVDCPESIEPLEVRDAEVITDLPDRP